MDYRLFVQSRLKRYQILIPGTRHVVQRHDLWLTNLPLRTLQGEKSLRVNSGQSASLALM